MRMLSCVKAEQKRLSCGEKKAIGNLRHRETRGLFYIETASRHSKSEGGIAWKHSNLIVIFEYVRHQEFEAC